MPAGCKFIFTMSEIRELKDVLQGERPEFEMWCVACDTDKWRKSRDKNFRSHLQREHNLTLVAVCGVCGHMRARDDDITGKHIATHTREVEQFADDHPEYVPAVKPKKDVDFYKMLTPYMPFWGITAYEPRPPSSKEKDGKTGRDLANKKPTFQDIWCYHRDVKTL